MMFLTNKNSSFCLVSILIMSIFTSAKKIYLFNLLRYYTLFSFLVLIVSVNTSNKNKSYNLFQFRSAQQINSQFFEQNSKMYNIDFLKLILYVYINRYIQ